MGLLNKFEKNIVTENNNNQTIIEKIYRKAEDAKGMFKHISP